MRIKVLNAKRDSNFFSLPPSFSAFKLKDVKDQPLPKSPVFRKADKAIYWIMQLVSLILIRWIVIYPMDSAIQRLNNSGQGVCNEVGPRWWQKMFYVVVDGDATRKTWTTVNYIQITLRPNCFFFMQSDWVPKKNVRIPQRPYKSHPPSTSLLLFQFSVFLFLFWVITICGLFLWPCHFRSNLLVSGLLASVFSILLISWVAICRSKKAILTRAWIYYKDQIFFLFLFNLSVPVSLKIQ